MKTTAYGNRLRNTRLAPRSTGSPGTGVLALGNAAIRFVRRLDEYPPQTRSALSVPITRSQQLALCLRLDNDATKQRPCEHRAWDMRIGTLNLGHRARPPNRRGARRPASSWTACRGVFSRRP